MRVLNLHVGHHHTGPSPHVACNVETPAEPVLAT